MEQIEPHYLETILNVLTGAEKPVKSFEYGGLKISFHAEEPEVQEPAVSGFQAKGLPPKPGNDLAEMHKRLTGETALPDFMPAAPNANGR
jgi:hypothetical protein